MNIVKQKIKGQTYIYIRESFWDPDRKKYTSRNIKSYGNLNKLLHENPNFLQDLEAELQHLINERQGLKQKKIAARAHDFNIFSESHTGSDKQRPVLSTLGFYPIKRIWEKLSLSKKLRHIQRQTQSTFDFPAAIEFMASTRILAPDSKLAQWKRLNQLQSNSKLKLHHLYRALDLLIDRKDELVSYLNHQIAKQYQRSISVVLYDVTTYYFESQEADELRNFGFSKDNKVNQVQVVMGLLIDEDGIPVDYELFPGNQNEFGTMIPLLQKVREKYKIKRIIVTADRGLNSAANLLAIKEMGFDFVIAHRLRSSGEKLKKLIQDQTGWKNYGVKTGKLRSVSKYRITDDIRKVRVIEADGKIRTETIKTKLLINYSPQRARKDQHDRERLVMKARKLAEHPSLLRSELRRGGKTYLSLNETQLHAIVDEKRIHEASFWDGYYGITYSDETMRPDEVLRIHHSLWQIEESFRISKSLLKARPCFHWKERRIRAHFLICYLALVLHRLLEAELTKHAVELTAEQIISTLRREMIGTTPVGKEIFYTRFSADDRSNFDKICVSLGMGIVPNTGNIVELKQALRVRKL